MTSPLSELETRLFPFINYEIRPERWWGVRLERVRAFFHLLGEPYRHGRWIHIAGTKGKGSTAAMVEAVLREAGYRTGLYTSPHLVRVNERIRIGGRCVAPSFLLDLWERRVAPAVEEYQAREEERWGSLTWFEVITGLAFCAFEERDIEWGILETGLGGRLDATNVVQPAVTLITRIDYDHQLLLGSTLAAIAKEKAGILKGGVPCVSAPQAAEAREVLEQVAAERGVPLVFVPLRMLEQAGASTHVSLESNPPHQRFVWSDGGRFWTLRLPLLGRHQQQNAAVAFLALETLRREGLPLSDGAVVEGLGKVHWPGRFQIWQRKPWIVLDSAHNPGSAAALRVALEEIFPHGRKHFLIALAKDKDWAGVARSLGPPSTAIITRVEPTARMGDPALIAEAFRREGWRVRTVEGLEQAWQEATQGLRSEDVLCVAGSLFLVGALLKHLGWEPFEGEEDASNAGGHGFGG